MTNGEKLKEVFPNIIKYGSILIDDIGTLQKNILFDDTWWNSEYKESTTKNEAKYCDRNICLKNEYNDIGCEDCEVTKSQEPTTKNNLGVDCIDKWDIGGKEAELWIVKGKLQVRHRGTIHNIDMPSVTPLESRRGHWIKVHPLQENDEGDYMCSECRCGGLVWKPTTYCPNCGCAMVEPQESEE